MVHYASLTYNSTWPQHTLQNMYDIISNHWFESLPGLHGVKELIAAYIGATLAWAIRPLIEYAANCAKENHKEFTESQFCLPAVRSHAIIQYMHSSS